ncbi:MAG: hypothetical protein R3E97_11180 [Candidatus Eisenbacteria bacterium]
MVVLIVSLLLAIAPPIPDDVKHDYLTPLQATQMYLALGFPLPCPSSATARAECWGASSANGRFALLGARSFGEGCRNEGVTRLLADGVQILELDRAINGWVSDNGIVALAADDTLSFWSSSGDALGGCSGEYYGFPFGQGVTGFLPGTDLLIRAGRERYDGEMHDGIRCLRPDGSPAWAHVTSSAPHAVVVDESGGITVYCRNGGILVSLEGAILGSFEGSIDDRTLRARYVPGLLHPAGVRDRRQEPDTVREKGPR